MLSFIRGFRGWPARKWANQNRSHVPLSKMLSKIHFSFNFKDPPLLFGSLSNWAPNDSVLVRETSQTFEATCAGSWKRPLWVSWLWLSWLNWTQRLLNSTGRWENWSRLKPCWSISWTTAKTTKKQQRDSVTIVRISSWKSWKIVAGSPRDTK